MKLVGMDAVAETLSVSSSSSSLISKAVTVAPMYCGGKLLSKYMRTSASRPGAKNTLPPARLAASTADDKRDLTMNMRAVSVAMPMKPISGIAAAAMNTSTPPRRSR